MKPISFKPVSFLLSLAALTLVSSTLTARAEMSSTVPMGDRSEESAAAPVPAVEPNVTSASTVDPVAVEPTVTPIPEEAAEPVEVSQTNLDNITEDETTLQVPSSQVLLDDLQTNSEATESAIAAEPIPGTVETSAASLMRVSETSTLPELSSEQANPSVAQTEIDPGRATRGGASYVGIGVNLGLGGDTALGGTSFVINGKLGLTRTLSFRPAAIIGDDTAFLLPLTYDFVIQTEDPFERVPFAPFVGGGVTFTTDEDDNIGFLLTGGVDVPISAAFVANASLNVGFIEDSTDVGLILGVGYTFVGF